LINYNPKFFWMLARSNYYKFLHLDFGADAAYYSLPQNIVEEIAKFRLDVVERSRKYKAADAMLVVILQKIRDIPFVAPLDVPTGTQTNIKALKERYWTVLDPHALDDIENCCRAPSARLRDKDSRTVTDQ
jgi:hypothetical protein